MRWFFKRLTASICILFLIKVNFFIFKIIKDQNFPSNVREAIKKGFESAEKEFLTQYAQGKNGEVIDRSGSCAIVTLIVGK